MNEDKNGWAYVLNPIYNINGNFLTSANEIFDLEQNLPQSELNKLIKLNSGVSEIQEFYAVYNSPSYGKNTEAELNEMITSIDWVRIPGGEFPKMTPDNPYLWNYEKFIQTNGDIVITLPHVTGILGRGYKSISRYYLVNNQSEQEPKADDTRWQTLSPPTTKENPYLWEKQEIYYTDNIEEATPDETIFTLIGVMGDPGIDGTQIEYIFCFSNSRLKAPNNPTPENWDKDMDFQKLDFIPYPRIEDFNEKRSDYYWSDEPVGISKDNPAQWICKREYTFNEEIGRVLWGKFSDPKLYSTYGEDGVSIVSIETWYLISASNILTDTIKNAQPGVENAEEKNAEEWYKNSPSVNKENRYLWKKTITEYSAAIIDNPDTESDETKIKISISYEVIGSMGDPGIDGDSVEWIYTRTITNKKPTIFTSINDSGASDIFTEEDFLGDDPTNSDYIPHPTSDDFSKNKTNYYWSDDIQSVDDTYIYGWRAQRKKTNGIWGSFSDPVKILYKAKDGVSPNASFKSIIFIRSNEEPEIDSTTTEDENRNKYNTYENPIAPGWSDGIPGGTEKLWSSTRIFSSDGKAPQQESWTEPKVMSDSTDIEIIYCARENENYIDPNSLGNIILENGELTKAANDAGWFDEPNQIENDTNKTDVTPIWMAISRSVNGIWSNWEISKIKGERGNDGTSITIKGSYDTLDDFTNVWFDEENNKWKNPEGEETAFIVAGRLWVWNGSDKWEDVGQFKGDPGKTYYLHIIYAKSATTKDNGSFYVTESDLTDNSGIVPGKYIATWTDDKQGIFITQDLLDSLIWSKWVGNDGYGYEYIYKLSKTETPEKLPLVPNDWETNEDYQKPDYCPTDWSDNPLNVSKESPYCWQAYRVKIDGIWQPWQGHADTDEAALWSKFGKDGRGISSVLSWFCIDDIGEYNEFIDKSVDYEISEETTGIIKKTWYPNSPIVTDDCPYLWKKTITEYTELDASGTIGSEIQTVYELIGIKGAKGVDGSDIQWAFKLTKDFTQPTSNDSDWPINDVEGNELGKWTDDAQEVSSEYPYQWIINRTKSTNEWTPWGTPVYTEGESSPNYYKAILNNTYGNYIINSESYYKVSTLSDINKFVPNSENLSLKGYQNSLINFEWKKSSDSGILTPDPINNRLYEISILIFSDNTYSVSGPVVKGIWSGRDIQSTVFCRSESVPARPSGGTYNEPWPKNTDENGDLIWSDGIPERKDGESTTVWSSHAIFVPGGEGPKNDWSTPIQLTNTSSLQIRYYEGEVLPIDDKDNIIKPTSEIPDENNPDRTIEVWNDEWTETPTQNAVWMATRSYSYGDWSDWQIIKVKGETGKAAAIYRLYPSHSQITRYNDGSFYPTEISYYSTLNIDGKIEKNPSGVSIKYYYFNDTKDEYVLLGTYTYTTIEEITTSTTSSTTTPIPSDSSTSEEINWNNLSSLNSKDIYNLGGKKKSVKLELIGPNNNILDEITISILTEGPKGTEGKNIYPAGPWDETKTYKIENNCVPFVSYAGTYYILLIEESIGENPKDQSEVWGKFDNFSYLFSEFLMANWAKFGGENGAIFFDKYLFSQFGYTKDTGERAPYWEYESSMFDANNNLTDVFTPKLHLDFYNGLANLSCLCEPYVTPRESTTEPGVIRISPDSGFNIRIPCNCPDSETDSDHAQPMLHPVVVLPNLDDDGEQSTWAFDGAHVTILFEPGGQKYGNLSGPYASKIDKQNVFLLVCTDLTTGGEKGIYSPDPTYNQNLIFCNNKRGKYLILSPGSMVKLKVNIINDNETKYLHWIVENSGSIKEESVNIYDTSNCVSNLGGYDGKVVLDNNNTTDSLVRLHGADYPDYVNIATTKLPDAWGIVFYSGPEGFCPKNILFSSQIENGVRSNKSEYRYHYRVLDFIGKTGTYGNPLNPPDQANNFDYDPLI